MMLEPGTRLGPYEIVAAIGAGGMGEVYRARDPRLGRDVAVKVLPLAFASDPDRLRRFEQEARAAGALNHPNITAVHDVGSHAGVSFVVTELLEGETLRSALAGRGLSSRRVLDYALQVTQGLAAAHEKGIVHRDLKPENVFVTKEGRVKILDFGLARLAMAEGTGALSGSPTASAGTQPGAVLGTLLYMSPEQVRGRPTDSRSDIFSFGVVLYEMVTGRRPFAGDSAADTMSAILREDPPELSVGDGSVSPALDRIVRRCLEKNPEARFHSAYDLAFALETTSAGAFGSGVAPAPDARVADRPRTRARLVTACVALALAAVAAGFLAGRRTGDGGQRTFPRFQRLTFRHGHITTARFAPDGQTIVYAGAWDGRPPELFTTRAGATESRTLGLSSADVFSISSSGEMAINLIRPAGVPDVLARVPLAGGAPREMSESILAADWAPDGSDLAVIRNVTSRRTVEFPIGKVLYESPDLYDLRVSPKGDKIAILEGNGEVGSLSVLDLTGRKTPLVGKGLAWALAWARSGDEIWLILSGGEAAPSLHAVSLTGKVREILRSPGMLGFCDLFRDGRVLVNHVTWRAGLYWLRAGESREQDVSWLDWSTAADLSADGKTLLFYEEREAGDAVFLRRALDEPAIRLGDGKGLALSPDGRSVLAVLDPEGAEGSRLVLLPTGAGEPRTLELGPIVSILGGRFFPDGKSVVFWGAEAGKSRRLWVSDLAGGEPRPISPEGMGNASAVRPDGRAVAASFDRQIRLFPVEGGEPRVIPGQEAGDLPVCWDDDGRSLYVYHPTDVSLKVYRVDVESGRRELWKSIDPTDTAGANRIGNLLMAPAAGSYTYGVQRSFSDLYVVEGLR
jgi:Tol biopolymer transport system component